VPATFTVRAAGKVSPPTITIPAHYPVELTVVSGDGRAHRAVLRTTKPYPLSVPAHSHASVRVPAPRVGQYALAIDGSRAATLVIGGQPGP
jgi:hypothetical protein